MRELVQKCRAPLIAPRPLTTSPVQLVPVTEPTPTLQTLQGPSRVQQPELVQTPLARSAAPIVSLGHNPEQPRTTPASARAPFPRPQVSPNQLFSLCAFGVVTALVVLSGLARTNFRLRPVVRWTLDKLLRLGTAIAAVASPPFFLVLALMAGDAGIYVFMTILAVGGLAAMFSLWLTFGFRPMRDNHTGAVQPWSAIGGVALYAISAAGWTVAGFYTLLHFQ